MHIYQLSHQLLHKVFSEFEYNWKSVSSFVNERFDRSAEVYADRTNGINNSFFTLLCIFIAIFKSFRIRNCISYYLKFSPIPIFSVATTSGHLIISQKMIGLFSTADPRKNTVRKNRKMSSAILTDGHEKNKNGKKNASQKKKKVKTIIIV